MDIAGRRALVTGAGIGTGRAIALALAAAGADVVVSDIDEEAGTQTAVKCSDPARFVRADLTAPDDVRRLVDASEPTILVNNAGGGGHIPPHFPEASPAQWGAILDLNLRAPMLATQLALAPMRRAGGGAIVTAEERATIPPPIPLATITAEVIRLISDDSLTGRAVVIWRGEDPRSSAP